MNTNITDAYRHDAPEGTARLYRLPNGRSVYHLNKYETDFAYREIFEEQTYFRHGIHLKSKACVFDVGASIGLFSLFAKQVCPDARIFAFEPSPELCRLLRRNVAGYGSSVQVYECGISARQGTATFTYYPNYSMLSGFRADPDKDRQTLSAGIRNQVSATIPNAAMVPDQVVEMLTGNKLECARQSECQLRSVSSVLRETGEQRIDLLKIDAEKSELDVLRGIDENDWPKIEQVVMEIHDKEQSGPALSLLADRGFDVATEQEGQFATSDILNVYARRTCNR